MKSTIDQHQQGTISGNIRSYSIALHGELQALGAEEGGVAFNALGGIVAELEGVQQLETLLYIDKTRAAANKMLTGQMPGSHRFASEAPDPVGQLNHLDITAHFTPEVSSHENNIDQESTSSAILRHIATLREELVRLGAEEGGTAFHALNGIASEVERISGLEAFSPKVFHVEDVHSGKLLAQVDGEDEETRREQFKNAAYELAYMDAK